jgi:hypothetical protein
MADKKIEVKGTSTAHVKFLDDGCILVKDVRLSYEHVFKKWGMNEGDNKKFSGKFLLDKKTHAADIKALGAFLVAFQTAAFDGRIPNDKLFLQDGANSGKAEMENCFVISASEDKAPDVINRDKSRINEDDDIVYSGCYVNVLIRPWKQANKFGKRVNANLLAVQFVRDGERFSGIERPDIDSVFDEVEGEFEGAGAGSTEPDPFAD